MPVVRRVSSPVLVGREQELRLLDEVLAERDTVRPVTVVLGGEAGMGKSRLVAELITRAAARGERVLTGSCVDLGDDALPFAPFVELLSDLARTEGSSALSRLAGATAPELARLLPSLGGSPETTTSASSSRLYAALHAVLDGLAARSNLLVVIEDVHWSDRASRELVAVLARQLRGRVAMLLTLRTDEVPANPPVERFVVDLERIGALRVDLTPLTRDEQAHQLSGILGVPPTAALVDEVHDRSEGNPFFAEELVALGSSGDLPSSVRQLLAARLEALPAATQQALRAAAAVGRQLPAELLDRVADVREARLDDTLRPAVAAHVLLADGRSYAFRHALLHETVLATLLPGETTRLHRRIAQTLTDSPEMGGTHPAPKSRIAYHWHAAGDSRRALTASLEAATEASRSLAFAQALAHYDRVLQLLDDVADGDELLPGQRYVLLRDAAEAAHLAGHPQRAADLVGAALDRVDPQERHHVAYLHERMGRYLWMAADGEGALRSYRRAVELVPREPVNRWRAAIVSGWSQALMLAGRFEESRRQAELAISLARQVPDGRPTEGHARNNLGVCLVHLGAVDGGVDQLRLARQIAEEEFDDPDDIARAVVNLSSVLTDVGRYEEALAVAVEGIGIVDRLGLQRRNGVWCRCDAAEVLLILGRCEEATDLTDAALALAPEGIAELRVISVRGELTLRLGHLHQARQLLEHARELARHVVDGHVLGPLYRSLVETMRAQAEPLAALDVAQEGMARIVAGDVTYVVPLVASAVGAAADAVTAVASQRGANQPGATTLSAAAGELLARAEDAAARAPILHAPARAALALAQTETRRAEGRSNGSEWEEVAAQWEGLGDRYLAAQSWLRAAEAYLDSGASRDRAVAAARRGRCAADEVAATAVLDAIDRLAKRARLSRAVQKQRPGPYALSRRERDVLELLVTGRTDRQIGQELFISHRTVERHVSNILAKLDAANRVEVTNVARESGLLSEPS